MALGIDVGGTKIAAAAVDTRDGALLGRTVVATRPERGGEVVLRECIALAERICAAHPCTAVGLGVCELVDRAGRTTSAETLDWRALDLAPAFAHLAPATVCSDVRAAALAEARLGAGAGHDPLLYVTVGTGVSCCLVVDGAPLVGARGNAIVLGAPPVELTASGLALSRRTAGRPPVDARAQQLLAEAAAEIGACLAVLVNALDPAALVVGGGLGLAPGFREGVERALRPLVYAASTRALPVLPAGLGADAGVVGAALAAADALS
jgi:glucokinase